MRISLGNRQLTLSAFQYLRPFIVDQEYVCYTVFQGANLRDPNGNLLWILGGAFLTRFYSIYDLRNHRIGLARSISYDDVQRPLSCSRRMSVDVVLLAIALFPFSHVGGPSRLRLHCFKKKAAEVAWGLVSLFAGDNQP